MKYNKIILCTGLAMALSLQAKAKYTQYILKTSSVTRSLSYNWNEERGYPLSNAFDGNDSTEWRSSSNQSSIKIKLKYTESVKISGIMLQLGSIGYYPNEFEVYATNSAEVFDKSEHIIGEWAVFADATISGSTNPKGIYRYFVDDQNAYKYFKVTLNNAYKTDISEILFFYCDHQTTLTHHDALTSTCSQEGNVEYWECPDCHKTFSDASGSTVLNDYATSIDENNHVHVTHHTEVPAHCDKNGTIEYWSCDDCKKLFSDADCTNETTEADLVIPMFANPYVQVGTDQDYATYLAYCCSSNYSGTQALYYKSEIDSCKILSYAFFSNNSGVNLEKEVWVYMGETTKEDLETPLTKNELTEVFHGNLVLGQSYGWEEVTLTTPFDYKGKGNLVVAIYTKSQSTGYAPYRCEYSSGKTFAICRNSYSDSSHADIDDTSNSYNSGERPIIRFKKKIQTHVADLSVTSTDGYTTCTRCGDTHAEADTLGTVALQDGIDYTRTTPCTVTNSLTYSRNFTSANQWESLYMPLSFEFNQAMAEKCEIAEIHTYGITNVENGMIGAQSEKVVLAQPIKVGSTVLANVPYLIRAKSAGKVTFTSKDKILHKAEATSVSCGTMRETLTFTGNYEEESNLADSGYYTMQHGQLVKISSNAEYLNSYRWYMTSSSNRTASTINIKSTHVHTDKNADGECDGCGYLFPLTTLVTEENYEELGLTVDHCGYYYIGNYQQLRAAMAMYDEKEDYVPLNFVLTNNIVANASIFDDNDALQSNLKAWNCTSLPQHCTFDGNGHTINGLYCNDGNSDYVGLFSVAGYESIIKNIGITNSYFKGSDHQFSQLGGIAGLAMYANISGCWIDSTKLEGGSNFMGGIVGIAQNGEITDCQSSADINSNNTNVYTGIHLDLGGIAGLISGTKIVRCQFSGKIQNHNTASIGGIVGFAKEAMSVYDYCIDQCVADGSITLTKGIQTSAAGIIADVIFDDKDEVILNVTNCLNKMNITCPDNNSYAAGIAEYVYNAEMKISSCLNTGTISGNNPIVDYTSGAELTISNCYYKGDSNSDFDANTSTYSCTADTLKTGYVTFKLNGSNSTAWRQNLLGSHADALPVPDPSHKLVVKVAEGKAYSYTVKDGKRFGTFCYDVDVALPESMSAFHTVYVNNNKIYGLKVEDGVIPAGTPVILSKPSTENNVTISFAGSYANAMRQLGDTCVSGQLVGLLKVVDGQKLPMGENPNFTYTMQTIEGVQNFYLINTSNFKATQYRCYLDTGLGQNSAQKEAALNRGVCLFEGEETGFQELMAEDQTPAPAYNLQGQRVQRMDRGGIYVQNNKRSMIK